jgi:glycosyltransferase involved in cell wall biosynthesis
VPEASQPLVTVAIPCHNYGAYVAEAINSALNQSYPRIEVVVVDDGSTDDSAAVVTRFGNRVRLVRQPNAGLSSARNRAAEAMHGDYVVFLDADDILATDFVTRTFAEFQADADPALAFVYTQMKMFGRAEGVTNFQAFELPALLRDNFIHASALLRSELVRRFPYDQNWRSGFEDWDFYLTLCENGYHGKLVDAPLLSYRKHDAAKSMYESLRSRDRDRLRTKLIWKHRGLYLRHAPSYLRFVGGKLTVRIGRIRGR